MPAQLRLPSLAANRMLSYILVLLKPSTRPRRRLSSFRSSAISFVYRGSLLLCPATLWPQPIVSDLNATNILQHAVSRLRPPHLRSIDGEVGPGRGWPCLHRRAKLLASSHARGKETHFGVPRISLPVPGIHRFKIRKAPWGNTFCTPFV